MAAILRRLVCIFPLIAFSLAASPRAPLKIAPFHTALEIAPQLKPALDSVVRITARGMLAGQGTGFFLADSGYLVTNNHVVGATECVVEGCLIEIDLQFQHGSQMKSRLLKVQPVLNIPELDVMILRVVHQLNYKSGGYRTSKFTPPPGIPLSASGMKRDDSIFLIGHPQAHLKRWTEGVVLSATGDWIDSTVVATEGMSGSPALNRAGELVGILHRGDCGSYDGLVAPDTLVNVTSISAWKPAQRLLDLTIAGKHADPLEDLFSIDFKEIDPEELVDLADQVGGDVLSGLLHAIGPVDFTKQQTKHSKGQQQLGLALAKVECQASLESPEGLRNPDDAFAACQLLLTWVHCHGEKTDPLQFCPNKEEQKDWLDLINKVTESLELKNQAAIGWVAETAGIFERTEEKARQIGKETLEKYVSAHPDLPTLTRAMVWLNLGGPWEELRKTDQAVESPLKFEQEPHYRYYNEAILKSLELMQENASIEQKPVEAAIERFMQDTSLPAMIRLHAEDLLYGDGLE